MNDKTGGMTLRDYFADKALQGYIASPHADVGADPDDFARDAYAAADAMLAERAK